MTTTTFGARARSLDLGGFRGAPRKLAGSAGRAGARAGPKSQRTLDMTWA